MPRRSLRPSRQLRSLRYVRYVAYVACVALDGNLAVEQHLEFADLLRAFDFPWTCVVKRVVNNIVDIE